MKIKRLKKVNRNVNFFCRNFGFRQPYQILIDGTFCFAALKNKVGIRECLPKYFDSEVKIVTTACVIVETEKFGKPLAGATQIAKQFPLHRCGHAKKPIPASDCFLSMIQDNNPNRYIVATQDHDLRNAVRQVPGTPVLFLYQSVPSMEKPSDASVKVVTERKKEKTGVSGLQQETLQGLKRKLLGDSESVETPKKKRKRRWVPPHKLQQRNAQNNVKKK